MGMKAEEKKIRDELIGADDFTTFQQNYLVEAGAGAGKTYTMVRRIANHLISGGCEPENLVAITFTKKATEEMRSRLDARLQELLQYAKKGIRDESGDAVPPNERKERVERLERLVRTSGRMQISTIHSFCQTMLTTMPFASPLGPGTEFGEDEGDNIRAFFERYTKTNPNAFQWVQSHFGLSKKMLADFFLARCNNKGAHIVTRTVGSSEVTDWENTCRKEAIKLHKKLRELLGGVLGSGDMAHLNSDLADTLSMSEADFAKDTGAQYVLIRLVNQNSSTFPLRAFDEMAKAIRLCAFTPHPAGDSDFSTFEAAHPLVGKLDVLEKCWKSTSKKASSDDTPAVGLLRIDSKLLLYAYLMNEMNPVLAAYRAEKAEKRQAFSDDQLIHVRDMLRDNQEARKYFRRRYQAIYVDEYQDTDPIQTELLFFLTAEENSFDAKDWKKCRPRPGSLFLVGDPKQSIYGFRGADITIYREVYALFQKSAANPSPIGKHVELTCSFRASEAVCTHNNTVFKTLFDGKPDYQAKFSAMDVDKTAAPCTGVFTYQCTQETDEEKKDYGKEAEAKRSAADAQMLCDFIREMVQTKNGATKPFEYRDFMILTPTTATVSFYMNALAEAGIPANITGKHTYGDFPPLQRLTLYLKWLLGRDQELSLLELLHSCYHVELSTVHALLERGGWHTLSVAFSRDESKAERFRALAAALQQEKNGESDAGKTKKIDALLSLCGVLEELAAVRHMVSDAPAMSTMEYILQSCRGIWSAEDSLEHRRQCGWLLQFLALLRGYEQHSFPALAAFAIDSMSAEVSQELALDTESNCVRVMNLHQAKGLEARVVILSYSVASFMDSTALLCRSNGRTEEYAALMYQKYAGARMSAIAFPPEWEGVKNQSGAKDISKNMSEAERIRLLYVAATRAADLLIINEQGEGKSFWARTTGAAVSAEQLTSGQDPAWAPYQKALQCLIPTASAAPAPVTTGAAAKPSVVTVSGLALEQEIAKRAEKLSESAYFAIVPSKLDHGTYAPKCADRSADDPAALTAQTPPESAEDKNIPRGAHWGTIVHSVMEQAVRCGDFTGSALEKYAREAASSVLSGGALSEREWDMVLGGAAPDEGERISYVAQKAAASAAFFSNPASELRRVIDGAACYPELPFNVCVADGSMLYHHLKTHLSKENLAGRNLDLQGVIDLAIWRDGEWTVVDYKTDTLRSNETEQQFCERLRSEYTAQIASYAQVLERLRGKVSRMALCSIALGGKLIDLQTDGENAFPTVKAPSAAAEGPGTGEKLLTLSLSELAQGRSFLPPLQSAQGAHHFSLMYNGQPVTLRDKTGAPDTTFKMCARFVQAVEDHLCAQYPNTPCCVDFSNAGSVVLLRRLIREMQRILPPDDWANSAFRWECRCR